MEKIKIEDLYKFKSLSNIEINDNGDYGCFIVYNVNNDEYESNIWGYDLENKKYDKLTDFKSIKHFIWTENNKILFTGTKKDKCKDSVYYELDIKTRQFKELFKIDKNISSIKKIKDNKYIFTSVDIVDKRVENDSYIELTEIPMWSNGSGYVSEKRNRIYLYDGVKDDISQITPEYMNVEIYNLNANRDKIVYIGKEYEGIKPFNNDIYVYDVLNNSNSKITKDIYLHSFVDFINENEVIVCGSDMKEYGENQNHNIYTIKTDNKSVKILNSSMNRSMWNTVCTDCKLASSPLIKYYNNNLYFSTSEGGSIFLNKCDLDGNIETLIDRSGSIDSYDIKNSKLLFIALRNNNLQELYEKDGEEIQITYFNNWINNKSLSNYESFTLEIDESSSVDGWVVKPINFEENKKYPAVLTIHGGPKMAFGDVFFHEIQLLANEGYVVILCNPRGSNGKDDKFSDIRGKFGTIDYNDIISFAKYVEDSVNYIDKNNMGVMGGSYGGFMTNWIIGHNDKFKAAISERGIANWSTMFIADIGYTWVEYQNKVNPWSDMNKLWNNSPLKYADKVTTPTLFIHGEKDYRCTVTESMQMYTSLRYHNIDSKLCIFKNEDHELSRSGRPSNRVSRLKEIINWLDKYLKN